MNAMVRVQSKKGVTLSKLKSKTERIPEPHVLTCTSLVFVFILDMSARVCVNNEPITHVEDKKNLDALSLWKFQHFNYE